MDVAELLKVVDAPAVALMMWVWIRSLQQQIATKDQQLADMANRFANIVEKRLIGGGK